MQLLDYKQMIQPGVGVRHPFGSDILYFWVFRYRARESVWIFLYFGSGSGIF